VCAGTMIAKPQCIHGSELGTLHLPSPPDLLRLCVSTLQDSINTIIFTSNPAPGGAAANMLPQGNSLQVGEALTDTGNAYRLTYTATGNLQVWLSPCCKGYQGPCYLRRSSMQTVKRASGLARCWVQVTAIASGAVLYTANQANANPGRAELQVGCGMQMSHFEAMCAGVCVRGRAGIRDGMSCLGYVAQWGRGHPDECVPMTLRH
jgi:hypothetical protein